MNKTNTIFCKPPFICSRIVFIYFMSKIHNYRIQVCVKPTPFPSSSLTYHMSHVIAHMIALPLGFLSPPPPSLFASLPMSSFLRHVLIVLCSTSKSRHLPHLATRLKLQYRKLHLDVITTTIVHKCSFTSLWPPISTIHPSKLLLLRV